MSGIPTFQQLMDKENEEKNDLGSNMQIKAPSGGKKAMRGGKSLHTIKGCAYDITKMANWCDAQAARNNGTGYPGGNYVDPDGQCDPVDLDWGDCTTAAELRDGNISSRGPNNSNQPGGKRRRTRTKKRRVKKIKRKARTRKYKRRSTKKRRSIKRRRKTKNHRRRGGGEKFDVRKNRLIQVINDKRIRQGKDAVPEQQIHDHIDKKVEEQKNIHEIVIQNALKAADPDGNTKTTLTGLVSSITPRQLDRTGHKDRVAIRKEVQHVKENNPNLTNIADAGNKAAEERAKRDIFNNMEKHVRDAVQSHDDVKQSAIMAQDAENKRKANIGELNPKKSYDRSVVTGAIPDEVSEPQGAYGKYGGRRRKRSNSRTRRKKRSGRRNRSRKV